MPGQAAAHERSIGELFGDLAAEARTLVRQEVRLATTELRQKASEAGKRALLVVAGALVVVIGSMTLTAGVILLLGRWIPHWAAALVVTAALAAIGFVTVRRGLRALAAVGLTPTETLASLEDNRRWLRRQLQ
jgi:uncharacterized membrane protein YqjE